RRLRLRVICCARIHFVTVARAIATMPARIAGGRFGHAATTAAKSGSAMASGPGLSSQLLALLLGAGFGFS
ncbi:MAG: hypothetical protein SFZ24_03100, partial [Planctomycetota bacterium]|nr:hypothetical protein [Planctomycetota bacterium]